MPQVLPKGDRQRCACAGSREAPPVQAVVRPIPIRHLHKSVYKGDKVISHRHKFVLLMVPKVARTSLLTLLTQTHVDIFAGEPEGYKMHLAPVLEGPLFKDYFKFAVVRNPWGRAVSCWLSKVRAPDERVARLIEPYPGLHPGMPFDAFVDWLASDHGRDELADRHWVSQHRFLVNSEGRLAVDFVGRYERLQADFDLVCDRLGLPRTEIPTLNTRDTYRGFTERYSQDENHSYYLDWLTPRTAGLLAERYRTDIEMFGYSCPLLDAAAPARVA